ncbi:MAG: thiamine pyrophosphate-dependent dehydrogenase E1 component subunit alpha, partial [Elusimicrobia bacterium]|nr:thiamine pyrophosphate-dependent dehydrogenase E1 component subunit alpha [Elusimicrobiota bacterium]
MQGKKVVTVAFFGDGGIEQGPFHESMNFASLKKLPLLFVCENNFLATCTPISSRQSHDQIYKRAAGYGVPGYQLEGKNVSEVYQTAKEGVERALKGEGPTFLEVRCTRWKEHVGPNFDTHLGFRSKEEVEKAMADCPIISFKQTLLQEKLMSALEMESVSREIQNSMEEAVIFAKKSPFPDLEELYNDI